VQDQFSQQLIDRMVAYALTKYNLRISEEQAVEYLRSLGNLYLTVSKIRARKHKKNADASKTHES
jgi:hypothetical protein